MTNQHNKNRNLMREGRRLFVAELDGQLQQLFRELNARETVFKPKDCKQLYRIVHTIKGSAGMFEYPRIGKLAERLVRLWAWTQDIPDAASASMEGDSLNAAWQEALTATPGLLRELALEYDIARVELEMDEQKELSTAVLPVPAGSRLLIIDDDDALRSYLVRRLRMDGYDATEASDIDDAKRLLREHAYDLVTLDLVMGPTSGYELFEFLKADPTLQWLPLIVISGREDVADKVRCFHLGADDYVTKPFQYEELAARIYGLLKRTKSFEQLAFHDPLTGVYNRRYFDNQIKTELQRVERYPAPLSIAFLDIDSFKSINDTYGHHIGDLVLQGLSHAVQKQLRATDLLARFGGEEFVIAMPNTDALQAAAVVESILEQARREPTAQYEGQEYRITFSAGVAEWSPGLSVQDWLQTADFAMYEAKQQGRNRVLIAGGGMEARLASQAEKQPPTPRKSVLIADNDPILRSIVVRGLQDLPVDIVEAENGTEAYRLLAAEPFDLCILDGIMPGLDGFALLERLRTEAGAFERERTKVLMMSSRKKEDDLARAYRLGAHNYVPKPFSLVELTLRVKWLLKL